MIRAACAVLVLMSVAAAGCGPSRNIKDLQPPPDQPPLQRLDENLETS